MWFGAKDENQTASSKPEKTLYGTNHKRDNLLFDKDTIEIGVWEPFLLPSFFDSSKSITVTVPCHSSATSGNFILSISLVGMADTEDEDPSASFVDFDAKTIHGTSHNLTYASKTISSHGLSSSDLVFPQLRRKANDSSDTMSADLWVEGFEIRFECTS